VLGGGVVAGEDARADILAFEPTYTFATPVLGGQASISLLGLAGHPQATVDATLAGPHRALLTGGSDDRIAFGGLLPEGTLRWNFGGNNLMTYITDIPVGAYSVSGWPIRN
jgi:hypothetical protein